MGDRSDCQGVEADYALRVLLHENVGHCRPGSRCVSGVLDEPRINRRDTTVETFETIGASEASRA
jgi:hypothetical protein